MLYNIRNIIYGADIMSIWEEYELVNGKLLNDFLCIPPYPCISKNYVHNLYNLCINNKLTDLYRKIYASINLPYQRAYQIDFSYKKCEIFDPFMSVIEYACYDAMKGNYICAYLSLVPVVEAVLRIWEPKSEKGKFGAIIKSSQIYKNPKVFNDERKAITDGHIKYLENMLDIFYASFKGYENRGYSDIFNRNFSLHKLTGAKNLNEEIMRNLSRIFLLLDVIAELYLMTMPDKYWNNVFFADTEGIDFNLRWQLYITWNMSSIMFSDIQTINNLFISNKSTESEKKALLHKL